MTPSDRNQQNSDHEDQLIFAAQQQEVGSADDAQGLGDAQASRPQPTTKPPLPKKIGDYRIIRKLGAGGMGIVYEAQQDDPHRLVALKVIRGGEFIDEHQIKLFQREIQSLARLKHSCIASIYHAGRTDSGQHYFAMELVQGIPITEYVEIKQLSLRERLNLFRLVCDGIHYAHLQGVIHRDLKPSNILIDEQGQAKILDFGLAKITDADASVVSIVTEEGKIQGTLPYMSPEQTRGIPDEIDFLSDIYALGVILYELLCEQLPYDLPFFVIHEAVRVINEVPPQRPSKFNRAVRGDLETIVLKTLEKDPARRYQSANNLSDDLNRYLSNDPIMARPPSAIYQAKKFALRNKALVIGAACVFLALCAGTVVSTLEYYKAEAARVLAVQKQQEAEESRISEAMVSNFLMEMLDSVGPSVAQGRDTTILREIMDSTLEQIGSGLQDHPLAEARIRSALGLTYVQLGEYDSAKPQLERSLQLRREHFDEDELETISAMNNLAVLYKNIGQYDAAEKLFMAALQQKQRMEGDEHQQTLTAMNNLGILYQIQGKYDEAEKLLKQSLSIQERVLGVKHENTLITVNNLAQVYQLQGRYDDAKPLLIKTLKTQREVLGDNHPNTLQTINALGLLYYNQGNFDKATPLFSSALEIRKRILGHEHPETIVSMINLAGLYSQMGQPAKAEPILIEAVEICKKTLGKDNPQTLMAMDVLASIYDELNQPSKAEALFREAIAIHRSKSESLGADSLTILNNLAYLYNRNNRFSEAEPLLVEAVAIAKQHLPEGNFMTGMMLKNYGTCLTGLQRYEESEKILLESYQILSTSMGSTNTYTKKAVQGLIDLYEAWEKPEKLEQYRALMESSNTKSASP